MILEFILCNLDTYPNSFFTKIYQRLGTNLIKEFPRADGPSLTVPMMAEDLYDQFKQGLVFLENHDQSSEFLSLKARLEELRHNRNRGLFLSEVHGKLKRAERQLRETSRV